MVLLVGLGNFGKEYQDTRHNFGFMLLDRLVADYRLLGQGKKHNSELFLGEISGQKIVAIKPQTYMNLSGSAVLASSSFFKIPTKKILVLHDDLDLGLGRIKLKIGGANGGHNGLKSIDAAIGSGYWRMRLGIGRPEFKTASISDYVLENFKKSEAEIVQKILKIISEGFKMLACNDSLIGEGSENNFLNQQNFLNFFYQEIQK